ncbi:MAG: hypothetical protein IPJ81_16385 [Chitinophagaceae bacterium]|nr:hypothetical protein [Chitinophagaceae bacterium]
MKILILLLAVTTASTNFKSCSKNKIEKCNTDENAIIWDAKKKLKWEDFQGIAERDSKYGAISSVRLQLHYKLKDGYLKGFTVCCLFFKNESWTTDNREYGLSHEQKHFDIGEIQARILRKELASINKRIEYINYKIIDSIVNNAYIKLKDMQTEYDEQTSHSLYYDGQEKWDAKIQVMLDSLKEYK